MLFPIRPLAASLGDSANIVVMDGQPVLTAHARLIKTAEHRCPSSALRLQRFGLAARIEGTERKSLG